MQRSSHRTHPPTAIDTQLVLTDSVNSIMNRSHVATAVSITQSIICRHSCNSPRVSRATTWSLGRALASYMNVYISQPMTGLTRFGRYSATAHWPILGERPSDAVGISNMSQPRSTWQANQRRADILLAVRICRDEGRRDRDRRSCVGHGGSRELKPSLWLRQLRSDHTNGRPSDSRSAHQCRRYGAGSAPYSASGCLSQPDRGRTRCREA